MKAPRFSAALRLSELMPFARELAHALLGQACAPGPYHPATPPTPAVAQAINNL